MSAVNGLGAYYPIDRQECEVLSDPGSDTALGD